MIRTWPPRSSGSRFTDSASAPGNASQTQAFATTRSSGPGFKYNMTDVQAAVGLHQLPRLDRVDRAPRASCGRATTSCWPAYRSRPLRRPSRDTRHARHLYQVLLEPAAPLSRDELLDGLTARNIGAGVHYRGVHLHPYYRDKYCAIARRLPGRQLDLGADAEPAAGTRT